MDWKYGGIEGLATNLRDFACGGTIKENTIELQESTEGR